MYKSSIGDMQSRYMKPVLQCDIKSVYAHIQSTKYDWPTTYCRDGELRLQDGSTRFEGRVEISFQQQWGTIEANGWGRNEANIACGR